MGPPISDGLGVAVVQGGMDASLAEELGRALSGKFAERGLHSIHRVAPPDEEGRLSAFADLMDENNAFLVLAPKPSADTEGMSFTIEVFQITPAPTPDAPEAVLVVNVWNGEADSPHAPTKDGVLPLFATQIVTQLVADKIVK